MHIEAVVVKASPWHEHDLRVVLYSREMGKLAAVARSARKASSRQAPALDAGTLLRCELVAGRGGYLITGAQAVAGWPYAKASPVRWAAVSFFLEALDVMVFDAQPDDALWQSVVGALAACEQVDEASIASCFRTQQSTFLAAMGYGDVRGQGPRRAPIDDVCDRIAGRSLASLSLFCSLATSLEG